MTLVELTEDDFEKFLALIYKTAGIRIPPTKRVLVTNRIRRRLRATNIADFSAYYRLLTSPAGASEMPLFLDEITTNETYFYRDMHQFDWLRDTFLPAVAEAGRLGKRPKTLRVWSAAASTGEELYSTALCIMGLRHLFARWEITLLGTDLSGAALSAARAATYDERAVRLVPAQERERYFDRDPASQRWIVKPEVRAIATWRVHNLMLPLCHEPFDCIFIKNVLIYFDQQSKQAVTRNLIAALGKGGYLVVGPTEGIYNMLDPLQKQKAWLYRRPEA